MQRSEKCWLLVAAARAPYQIVNDGLFHHIRPFNFLIIGFSIE
jgi:hypothetical protein